MPVAPDSPLNIWLWGDDDVILIGLFFLTGSVDLIVACIFFQNSLVITVEYERPEKNIQRELMIGWRESNVIHA